MYSKINEVKVSSSLLKQKTLDMSTTLDKHIKTSQGPFLIYRSHVK